MEVQVLNSSIITATSVEAAPELHKAWHLLALLLSFGRPARLEELASRCNLFRAPVDYIAYLCSIPNSPICLTNDLFVSPSVVAFVAFQKFISELNPIDRLLPPVEGGVIRPNRIWEDVMRTYYRRRKRLRSEVEVLPASKTRAVLHSIDESGENGTVSISLDRLPSNFRQLHFPREDYMTRGIDTRTGDLSTWEFYTDSLSRVIRKDSVTVNTDLLRNMELQGGKEASIWENMWWEQYVYSLTHPILNFEKFPNIPYPITVANVKAFMPHLEQCVLSTPVEGSSVVRETEGGDISCRSRMSLCAASCEEGEEQNKIPKTDVENVGHACMTKNLTEMEKSVFSCKDETLLIDSVCNEIVIEDVVEKNSTFQSLMPHDAKKMNDMPVFLDREKTMANMESKATFSSSQFSACERQLMKSSTKSMTSQKNALEPRQKTLTKPLGNNKVVGSRIQRLQHRRDERSISVIKMSQQTSDPRTHTKKNENSKEKKEKPVAICFSDQQDKKILPKFEAFTVEDEEGSGGYGTVYRAQRKHDGVKFAIKCPHTNANRHHVHNELKMLERFGGKNYVIKYEGSFKSGNSECIVLEHVEHDRPEILKKEIDVFQLRRYGYCMFRALAGLHKQGVVHRDVKPGNFLFSRKVNKGYLIDFNLAMDLHQKYGITEKLKAGYDASFNHAPVIHSRILPPTNQNFFVGKPLEVTNQDTEKTFKTLLLQKRMKKKVVDQTSTLPDLGTRNVMKSQGADGSGITSAKDVTSTKTPSTERLREPIPCRGRQELISLVHKALQGPNHQAQSAPASKRKRIAAFPGKVDKKHVYLTPMPLHSAGIAVAGAATGLVKNKGDGKPKREGPCVGTKGFRAPEVLFRSQYQGPKVDIWSAGVTLLSLMLGRAPFTGEPEQNIKEIAKLRGSEDLWEVAKLHNCESQFPPDLYDVQFLPAVKLQDWCKLNTKRPEFLEIVPRSLFDLVDKCLTVNPRLRISAEEALRHEFFAPCLESLKKERQLRKGLSFNSGSAHLLTESQELVNASLQ